MPISRIHRPRRFKDVTGQEHITETLRKEVASGVLGHAFLFSGPRGIGKTTSARIFAKALLNEKTDDGEPPVESGASKEIEEGKCIDLIEIDAASYTGVDNIREAIIEHVRFAPARWKRKVYIIDECHMLSASAWNAMLKTLEEPPAYAFFILATTELHKVPETIKSRCQRFEFKRVDQKPLAERIRMIAKAEKMSIDDDVVDMIVHASEGCVRDAESLLDQLSSLGTGTITSEIATLLLPKSRIPQAVELLKKCHERDVPSSLAEMKGLIDQGVPPANILEDLLAIVRSLITSEDAAERKRLSEGDDGERAIASILGWFEKGELSDIALMLIERRRDLKTGTDPLFILELIVLAISAGLLPHANGSPLSVEQKRESEQPKKADAKTNEYEWGTGDGKNEIENGGRLEAGIVNRDDGKEAEVKVREEEEEKTDVQSAGQKSQELDLHEVRKHWNQIISEVEKENRSIPFILKICRPESINGSVLFLKFEYSFHREKLIEELKTKRIVEQAIRNVMNCGDIIIDGIMGGDIKNGDSLSSAPKDIVTKVLNTFGGQVVE